jgi:KDO2-lipid IV(A) lauroyltransferase
MKKIRYFLEYILVRSWLWLMDCLPLKISTNMAARFFQIVGMRLKVSKIAKSNLQKSFPDLSKQEIEKIILQVWDNFGRTAAETSPIMKLPQHKFNSHIKITGLENLLKFKGKAALIYTAHLANWEFIAKALLPYDLKFGAIFRRANNRLVDKLIDDIRHNIDIHMIPKGKAGAKELLKALKNNEQIVMLVDQKMNDGIKIPFLGRDAMTAPAIATLAIRYDCPIIPIQVIRLRDSNFEMIIHPNLEKEKKTVEEIMLEINNQIGQWVKARPGQWFWLHRRWMD